MVRRKKYLIIFTEPRTINNLLWLVMSRIKKNFFLTGYPKYPVFENNRIRTSGYSAHPQLWFYLLWYNNSATVLNYYKTGNWLRLTMVNNLIFTKLPKHVDLNPLNIKNWRASVIVNWITKYKGLSCGVMGLYFYNAQLQRIIYM